MIIIMIKIVLFEMSILSTKDSDELNSCKIAKLDLEIQKKTL